MLLCNPRSLNNKLDEFHAVLDNSSVDLVAVTETWFSSERPMDHYNIPGYELYSLGLTVEGVVSLCMSGNIYMCKFGE